MTGPDDSVSREDVHADLAEGRSNNGLLDDGGVDNPIPSAKDPAGLDEGGSNQSSSDDDSSSDGDSFSDDDNASDHRNASADGGREAATNIMGKTIIEDFMEIYKNGLHSDFIELGRQGARTIGDALRLKKIKHEIFHRGETGLMDKGQTDLAAAKSINSTRKSIIRRQRKRVTEGKGIYASVDEVLKEMPDLAGIRIALYYPNDFQKVDNLIRYNFEDVTPPQDWPDREYGPMTYSLLDQPGTTSREISGRRSRFPGYFSRHFRVRFRKLNDLPESVGGKTLEIQVMSILMHAWAMINQELVYKPEAAPTGRGDWVLNQDFELVWEPEPVLSASEDDQRLLDIANGIIVAGEQVLRQLQVNLESKRDEKRRGLWDWIEIGNYLVAKWVDNGDLHGLNEKTRSALESALKSTSDGSEKIIEPLFNSWSHCELADRDTVDRIVEGALGVERTFPGGDYSNADMVIDRLCSFSVCLDKFHEVEARELGLPQKLSLRVLGSKKDLRMCMKTLSEATLVARYQALVVCNAMRLMAEKCQDYEEFLAKIQILGSFEGEKPSWEEFGDFVHPTIRAEPGSATLIRILNFCNHLLHCGDNPRWAARCALGRLGVFCYARPLDKPESVKLSACPAYFVQYLCGGLLNSTDKMKSFNYYVASRVTDEYPSGWVPCELQVGSSEIWERGLRNLNSILREFL